MTSRKISRRTSAHAVNAEACSPAKRLGPWTCLQRLVRIESERKCAHPALSAQLDWLALVWVSACGKQDAPESLALSQAEAGRLPRAHNEEDALKLVELAEKINEAAEDKAEIDADIVKKVAYTAAGELSPMAATLGGIVGQEVGQPIHVTIL